MQLTRQLLRGLLPILLCLVNRDTVGVNSLPKTVTRQRRGCDLNPGRTAPEPSTLTTRLPSHPITKKKYLLAHSRKVCVDPRRVMALTMPACCSALAPAANIHRYRSVLLSIDGTDRQTDGQTDSVPLHTAALPLEASSANNQTVSQKYVHHFMFDTLSKINRFQ